MTLPNIIELQQYIQGAYEKVVKGERISLPSDDADIEWHVEMPLPQSAAVPAIMTEYRRTVMTTIARLRLGTAGGRAPIEGGSFDWEVLVGVDGTVQFIIKSYTDQATVDRLMAHYRNLMVSGLQGDNPYDFR